MAATATTDQHAEFRTINSSLMLKVFYTFLALAAVSLALSLGGKWLGRSIALAGHTESRLLRHVLIDGEPVSAPENAIRYEAARRDGSAPRLDLYLHWPDLDGYSTGARDDFNNADGSRHDIIFASIEPRSMSRDMAGRFAPIYASLIEGPGAPGPTGLTLYPFSEKSGYQNEVLAVAQRPGAEPFVARCLTGPSAEESLAPCELDMAVGTGLSLTYRFPRELLTEWPVLDKAMRDKAAALLAER